MEVFATLPLQPASHYVRGVVQILTIDGWREGQRLHTSHLGSS